MTTYLQRSNVVYRHLVGEHVLVAIDNHTSSLRYGQSYGLPDGSSDHLTLSMSDYFDRLPVTTQKVVEKCNYWNPNIRLTVEEVEDAWFSMIFRAFCWQRSHVMISGVPPLPSEYWNSKMPVYIG